MTHVMDFSITETEETEITENTRVYRVDGSDDLISVNVTHNPAEVALWIFLLYTYLNVRSDRSVVGVRVEWRRSLSSGLFRGMRHGVDILQLCVDQHCLIYQIGHANGNIPPQLFDFFLDNRFTFVGVGIRREVEILNRNYGIRFGQNIVDLRDLYAMRQNKWWLFCKLYGLGKLNNLVLKREFVRPLRITMSRWDELPLHQDQVLYACIDAHVCYKIGQNLRACSP